jgi:hypothetical protein
MTTCHCCAADQQFDRRLAEGDLKRLHRHAEADRLGHRPRVTLTHADFRAAAPTTAPADVVTLDRPRPSSPVE